MIPKLTPGGREDSPGFPEDKENHAKLLREMRAEFDQVAILRISVSDKKFSDKFSSLGSKFYQKIRLKCF
jgi:hypothetical protein